MLSREVNVKNTLGQNQSPGSVLLKGVPENFAKFTGKQHLYQSLFINNVPGLRPATLLKKETGKIFKNTYFYKTPPVVASVAIILDIR